MNMLSITSASRPGALSTTHSTAHLHPHGALAACTAGAACGVMSIEWTDASERVTMERGGVGGVVRMVMPPWSCACGHQVSCTSRAAIMSDAWLASRLKPGGSAAGAGEKAS